MLIWRDRKASMEVVKVVWVEPSIVDVVVVVQGKVARHLWKEVYIKDSQTNMLFFKWY
jgi:hypothetical protein